MAIALLYVDENELKLMTMTHVSVNNNNCRRHVNNLGGIFPQLEFIELTTVLHIWQAALGWLARTLAS